MKPFTINKSSDYFFCTDTIVGWQYVFTSPDSFGIIIESLKYCQSEKGLRIHGYVIMPNHVHTILSASAGDLSGIIRDYKRFTSEKIAESLVLTNNRLKKYFSKAARLAGKGNAYKVWQSGSRPIAIESQHFFLQKLNYMHENPVRKGYVERPEHWMYSSARNYYLNDHSIVKIHTLE